MMDCAGNCDYMGMAGEDCIENQEILGWPELCCIEGENGSWCYEEQLDSCGVCDGDNITGENCNYNNLAGDLNGDGSVNVIDIVALVNIILNDLDPQGADYNGDGTVNVIDVVALVHFVLNN
jgi:hypothetical protein